MRRRYGGLRGERLAVQHIRAPVDEVLDEFSDIGGVVACLDSGKTGPSLAAVSTKE